MKLILLNQPDNMIGIYKIRNIVNNKIYVGSTHKSFNMRFKTHINLLNTNKHENSLLQNAWNKYGNDCFVFEIIESFDDIDVKVLLSLEGYYIIQYNSLNRKYGYNICSVGKSRYGTKWNNESKRKRCGKGNPMFEMGHLRIGELNPMYGKTLTQTHKDKMSKSLMGRDNSIVGQQLSKPVIMLDTNKNILNEYLSYSDALNKTKILHISEVCNGLRKSAGGYLWQWK